MGFQGIEFINIKPYLSKRKTMENHMIIGDDGLIDYADNKERPEPEKETEPDYEYDEDGNIICPFCGDSDSVDEDLMMCTYCKEHI